ncbi:hypothetical protein ABE504_21590 [Paenibacillus oryzisoli]|uniref:hypothetical protein n=1 Tax=Paenibacillus oryzisoli TaxID=1850517 RepID=UPI003D28E7F0
MRYVRGESERVASLKSAVDVDPRDQIVQYVDFVNLRHFNRVFCAMTERTPQVYREQGSDGGPALFGTR